MSLSDSILRNHVVVAENTISLANLTPAVHLGPQGEATIYSSLEAQDHGIKNASGSFSVRIRIQLIATLLALFVRATLKSP
jgi:hypothetical protein